MRPGPLFRLVGTRVVNIAHRHEIDARDLAHQFGHRFAAAAATEEGDVDAVIGAAHSVSREGGGGSDRCRGGSELFEEVAPFHGRHVVPHEKSEFMAVWQASRISPSSG